MKYHHRYFTLLVAVLLLIGLVGCSKDSTDPEPEPINESSVLLTYIEGAGGNYRLHPVWPTTKLLMYEVKQTMMPSISPARFGLPWQMW